MCWERVWGMFCYPHNVIALLSALWGACSQIRDLWYWHVPNSLDLRNMPCTGWEITKASGDKFLGPLSVRNVLLYFMEFTVSFENAFMYTMCVTTHLFLFCRYAGIQLVWLHLCKYLFLVQYVYVYVLLWITLLCTTDGAFPEEYRGL